MKTRILPAIMFVMLLGFSVEALAAEWTAFNVKIVKEIYVKDDAIYLTDTTGSWGTTCAPSSIYLSIALTEPNARELLSVALTAQSTARKLSAYGTCTTGSGFFSTNYLIIH